MNTLLAYFFSYVLPFGILLLALLAGCVAIALLMEGETRWRQHALPLAFGLMLLAMTVGPLLSGRNVSASGLQLFAISEASAVSSLGSWAQRLATLAIVMICTVRIMATLFRSEFGNEPRASLFVAFVIYYIFNSMTNALLGTKPAFIHGAYYALLLFALVHAARQQSPLPTLHVLRNGLLAFFLASIAATSVFPDVTLQRGYEGAIPGLSIRFWGLGSNPNSIGPLSVVTLLLLNFIPYRKPWLQRGAIVLALFVLVLSQSKTAWGGLLIGWAVLHFYRYLSTADNRSRGSLLMLFLMLSAFAMAGLVAYAGMVDLARKLQKIAATESGLSALTLTGRVDLWLLAIDIWKDSPWFGYGLNIWDLEHRIQLRMPHAFSAHNQFLQSLAQGGILALMGLLAYVTVLAAWARRAAAATRGLSLALLALILVRCISETPLETETLLSGDLITHALLFHLLLHYGKPTSQSIIPNRTAPLVSSLSPERKVLLAGFRSGVSSAP